uniref:26S proteasome regulatory subunit Rpn6 N-terminal domain-containing protein n=1 Tax=Sinocyclocheilus rhinocerous TaxID=307959 RepID=A0A673GE62_9TELE
MFPCCYQQLLKPTSLAINYIIKFNNTIIYFAVHVKEQSILELGGLLAKTGQAAELGGLLKYVRPFLNSISKAKAARLV